MKRYFSIEKAPVFIKFLITLVLFVMVKDLGSIDSFSHLVIALLEFIIVLELVRMLIEFLFSSDNRIKLRLMIDSTIVFFIRDIMLIANEKLDVPKMVAILGVIGILFVFRYVAMKFSPSVMEKQYQNKEDA